MARKAPTSYENMRVVTTEETEIPVEREEKPATDLLRDVAQRFVIYLHPNAHRTIARYALEQSSFKNKVRPHDIIVTAVEEFFASRGLQGPVRAKPKEK